MGSVYAEGLTEIGLSLEEQILVHLTSNHYPPVPRIMVPVCVEAIDEANEGRWDTEIELPAPVKYLDSTTAPVHAIIEQHHLEFWIIESELDEADLVVENDMDKVFDVSGDE